MKLYEHQQEALDATKNFENVAYYLDMGLGKTFVGSEKLKEYGDNASLVVCQKSKIEDWVNHFKQYYPEYRTYSIRDTKQMQQFVEDVKELKKCVGVINYDSVFKRDFFKKQMKDFTLMLDESSIIQNEKSKRAKYILSLHPHHSILLSGTPVSGKYERLWSQLKLLGYDISLPLYHSQFVNFEKIYVGGVPLKVVSKKRPYKNIDRLRRKLREHGAVFMKTSECFSLPKQTFIDVKVKNTKSYKIFEKEDYIDLDLNSYEEFNEAEYVKENNFEGQLKFLHKELVGDTTLSKRLYLRQLCSQYNKSKFEAFSDLLESTQDRIIVFYSFNDELDKLKQICNATNKPISEVNGHVKDLSNYETEENSITLVQYQAGAKGLNLQKANKIIYFSPTEKCEDWMQSQKRIHRIGQVNKCFYYKLIAEGSIDQLIYHALERGVDYTDKLFKEDNEKWK